jgi:hypothetical protein
MSADPFRVSESELDALLDAARDDLAKRGIAVADGSARETEVWAYSFSTEREIGIERQRVAATLTLRGDAPLMMQSIATGSRLQHRDHSPIAWPELRRRGLAAIVEDALASAQYHLQLKIGADFAHQELIRRCESILDLIGDDLLNAPALRDQVAAWKTLAEQRSLYSAVRRNLVGNLDFGHLQDDANALQELYENDIYKPLSSRAPEQLSMRGDPMPPSPPPEDFDRAVPRRISLLKKIPKAPPPEPAVSTAPLLLLGIGLAVVAVALLATAFVRHSWGFGLGGAVLLGLVIRALRQWHA